MNEERSMKVSPELKNADYQRLLENIMILNTEKMNDSPKFFSKILCIEL